MVVILSMLLFLQIPTKGHTFCALSFQFQVGYQTVGKKMAEVVAIIWNRMAAVYMAVPNNANEWRVQWANFWAKWQFPHCLGALDGKHILIRAPRNSGWLFYNYKNLFSVVLTVLVDAYLQFICIDAGAHGRNSDGGIFSNSSLGKGILHDQLHFPADAPLLDAPEFGPMPYVIVGDEAFPLNKCIMRPYPGK